MKILDRLRQRPQRGGQDSDSAKADPADGRDLPIARYDHLDEKKLVTELSGLSQVDLAVVESHERSHQNRQAVLRKLRYLRQAEPLTGYDALDIDGVARALEGADAETVKAVRDYERIFQRRRPVLDETARVLPTSAASAGEDRAREDKAARVREGFAGQKETASGLASSQPGD